MDGTYIIPALGPAIIVDINVKGALRDDLGHDEAVCCILSINKAALLVEVRRHIRVQLLLLLLKRHCLVSCAHFCDSCCPLRGFFHLLPTRVIDWRQAATSSSGLLHSGIARLRTSSINNARRNTALFVHSIVTSLDIAGICTRYAALQILYLITTCSLWSDIWHVFRPVIINR